VVSEVSPAIRKLEDRIMAMSLLRGPVSIASQRSEARAAPPSRRETLAIVSTASRLCGVAAYTAALERQLAAAFDITLFKLDQYLMRSKDRRVRKLADREVMKICCAIRRFDVVNLQLEHGTLGRHGSDIFRRFRWLTEAAPRLSVTFHTLPLPARFDMADFVKAVAMGNFKAAARLQSDRRRARLLSRGFARQLRRLQRRKRVSAIVHNRRDRRDVHYLYGVEHVFDHPLSYFAAAELAAIRAGGSRRRFPLIDPLPVDAVLIGVFGFLNEYKGIGTAIDALHHLPDDHHLLIFGGVHPQEIKARQARHPYISSLFDQAYMDTTLYQRMGALAAAGAPRLVIDGDAGLRQLMGNHPRDLSSRVHFMGALDEEDFLAGMAICDTVVFPYLEVGQSSSGPISQALELGCRIVASRTNAFLEFAEYHRNAIEFFDIGNHLELAGRVAARRQFAPREGLPEFNVETNKATYILANSALPASSEAVARLARGRETVG
jgi:glycosyltransferase involved in cell wall biosynthesis